MSFKVTIKTDDGEVLDELTCDCIAGAMHEEGSDDYQSVFYADCDGAVALRCLRTAMQVVTEHLTDEAIVDAMQDGEEEIVCDDFKPVD